MRISTIRWLACAGLGSILGLVAALVDLSPRSKADGTRPTSTASEACASGESASCCSDGLARDRLLSSPPDPAPIPRPSTVPFKAVDDGEAGRPS